ncbi:hypothetical protein BJX64DRAFT_253983 [Aspergillus heterothallicus]
MCLALGFANSQARKHHERKEAIRANQSARPVMVKTAESSGTSASQPTSIPVPSDTAVNPGSTEAGIAPMNKPSATWS